MCSSPWVRTDPSVEGENYKKYRRAFLITISTLEVALHGKVSSITWICMPLITCLNGR